MRLIYNIVFMLAAAAGFPVMLCAVVLSEKRRKTFLKRLFPTVPECVRSGAGSDGRGKRPIWIHALSVGEVLSAVPLVRSAARKWPDRKIVFSASTRTGYATACERLRTDIDGLFYFPYDVMPSVRYAIRKIRPHAVMLVESDIWPNFLAESGKCHVPVFWVNARMSDRSFRRYRRIPGVPRYLFSHFTTICAQTREDARRLQQLGVAPGKISVTGNIKFDQPVEPVSDRQLTDIRKRFDIGTRRILVAGSTHKGEERLLADALVQIRQSHPDLLMMVAPRDPGRGVSAARVFESAGFQTTLWTADVGRKSRPAVGPDVIVVDTLGILKILYALSDITFVGGSLVPLGGHNPLEPASYSKPVLFGPCMNDFARISSMLLDAGGARRVRDVRSLTESIGMFLADETLRVDTGARASRVFRAHQGAVENTLRRIKAS